MANNERLLTPHQKEIVKVLEKGITAHGHDISGSYRDWLRLCKTALRKLPEFAKSVGEAALAKNGAVSFNDVAYRDDEKTAAFYADMHKRYHPKTFKAFSDAFGLLLAYTNTDLESDDDVDMVGEIYEKWSYPNSWAGQFFSPMNLCTMMGAISNVKETVEQRVKAALEADPVASLWLFCEALVSNALPDVPHESKAPKIVDHLIAKNAIAPTMVLDPCCGSGRMFLGVMRSTPCWMWQKGLIQFYGMDIDEGCVMMTRINLLLQGIGMNYVAADSAFTVDPAVLTQIPSPYKEEYLEAVEAVEVVVKAAPPATQQQVKEEEIREVAAAVGKRVRGKNANQLTLW